MKVKNIFSNRKTKKKKTITQTASASEAGSNNTTDRLIIPNDSKGGNTSGKENEPSSETAVLYSTENVVLRNKTKKSSVKSRDNYSELSDETKPRASSTSSNNSAKLKTRRPWSFIEQLRRQDSRESAYSTGSSVRTSQVVEELLASTPPPQYEKVLRARDPGSHSRTSSGACTLPRSLTPEQIEQASKSATKQDNSVKRRTMDFRFFNFFKRSSSGDSDNTINSLNSQGRSSFRSKNKGKKKGSKKKRDTEESRTFVNSSTDNNFLDLSRMRSFSDGGETSPTITFDEDLLQVPPVGLYDSEPRLNRLDERPEPTPEKRVPDNGEPAFYFVDDPDSTPNRQSSSSDTITSKPSSLRKYQRRSDPISNGHSLLRIQMSEGSVTESNIARSTSNSTDSSSRRSSFVCEPRNFPLPEDSIASFDSSAYLGARARKLHSAGSVPQIPLTVHNQKVQRALSNDIPKMTQGGLSAQARCSQSVSNLASDCGQSASSVIIPRSSSDVDKPRAGRRVPQPSPHQQKQDELNSTIRPMGVSTSTEFIPPPSPVLRAIGYPGVVLRRNKNKRDKQRPNSAYADQRTQHVLSLNVEDLPTYTQMRFDMTKANAFPSYEDILAVRETGSTSKRGSNGVQFASTASGRARRRGATLSNYGQRVSAGFATAVSVEDLDSLSSSNYGSKQSLSDLTRMDDDEMLNAFLAKSHAVTHTSSGNLRGQEPSSKRAKAIRKSVVSLANLISPGKPNQKGKLQRSSSFKESGSSAPASNTAAVYSFKPYRPPSNTPNRTKNNRRSKLWCETFDHTGLNEGEIKWQEAIFELYQGERDLVQDLTMAKQTYRDSMVTLKMLSDEEVTLIFGKLGCLLPLHEELLAKLEQARGEDGRTLAIGYIFVEWFPRISTAYREYCANQSDAKYALDAAVERDARVRDFLQRCLESPFSRKLDLWSYLDLPRTRLVKYPLLLQNVLKRTPGNLYEEKSNLNRVMEIIGEIIERVDETTGEQQCRYIRSKLEYLDDKQKSPFVDNSRLMLCSGQLKNNRGTKMHVFLFEEAFVLTRQTTRSNKVSYQVYRHPLPLRSLVVDTNEGDKLSGSFRGGILSSEKVKHSFRVRSEELNVSYTLQASEEHDRKQWINAIQDALAKYKLKHPEIIEGQPQISRRRATYDPSSKKANSRVLRSSSNKSNKSVGSSTDNSSLQEQSQEDDVSITSEDTGPWRRTRSHTVNPSILTSKSSSTVSRKSSGSSTKSDKSSESSVSKPESTQILKDRLRRLESEQDGPPSPLRNSFRGKKSSISRHFSLGKGDKAQKPTAPTKADENVEKTRNKCQRSRSLTSSPQTVKSVVARFGSKRLSHGKLGAPVSSSLAPNAAKPPIGPCSSPFSVRRTPSLKNHGTLHEARSTPNLAMTRSTSFSNRRTAPKSSLLAAHNSSNSVGNLRKELRSASDLGCSSVDEKVETRELLMLASEEKTDEKIHDEDIITFEAPVVTDFAPMEVSTPVETEMKTSLPDPDLSNTLTNSAIEDQTISEQNDTTSPVDDVMAEISDQSRSEVKNENKICEDQSISEQNDTTSPVDDVMNQSVDDVMAEFSDQSRSEVNNEQVLEGDLISFGEEVKSCTEDSKEGNVVPMDVVEQTEDLATSNGADEEMVESVTDNDEGIVQDEEDPSSDIDNNNIKPFDSETDEQICLDSDKEITICCRDEITDEISNRQANLESEA